MIETVFEEFVQTLPMAEQIRFELMAVVSDLEDLDPEEVAEQFFATNPTREEIEEYSAQIYKISEWLQSFAEELDHLEAEREIAELSPRRRPLRYVYVVGYSQGEIKVLDRRAEHV